MISGAATTAEAPRVRARAIGAVALGALGRNDGQARPIPAFPDAPYLLAGDAIVWIGVQARSMHPRMIVLDAAPASVGPMRVDASALVPWQPLQHALDRRARAHLVDRAATLRARARDIDVPRGFGTLLVAATPSFPLDLAVPRVDRFITALGNDDEGEIEASARALLGVGTGLTPSGDDLVGAALFARRLAMGESATYRVLAQRMIAHAAERTHVISAALFADLVTGESYGLLHDVVDALLSMQPIDEVIAAARKLVVIGHSSGWDMLTGLLLSLGKSANEEKCD